MLVSRAFRAGVEVLKINPAFTSVIGRVKFAHRYGLSIHHAAALVIGRRALGFSERVPSSLDKIPDGHGSHVTLLGLEKIQVRHVWSIWGQILKKLKIALAAQDQIRRQNRRCDCVLTGQESSTILVDDDIPF